MMWFTQQFSNIPEIENYISTRKLHMIYICHKMQCYVRSSTNYTLLRIIFYTFCDLQMHDKLDHRTKKKSILTTNLNG